MTKPKEGPFLDDFGLSKKVLKTLIEQGIDSVPKLMSFSLEDIEALEGIGPKALMQIAKVRDSIILTGGWGSAPDDDKGEPSEQGPKKYMTQEPPESERTVTTKEFKISLQFRHAEWIKRAAEAYDMTEEQVIEQAIRQAYQRDPYKAGATAVSGSILKHDNPHTQQLK